jgi:hypothetical protein
MKLTREQIQAELLSLQNSKVATNSDKQMAYWADKVGVKPLLEANKKRIENTKRPISQFDLDGNWVADWPSTVDAAAQYNITSSSIGISTRGNFTTVAGFYWRKKTDKKSIKDELQRWEKEKYKSSCKQISQFDLEGKWVADFESVSDVVEKFDIYMSQFNKALKGIGKPKGYYWRYKDGRKDISDDLKKPKHLAKCKAILQLDLSGKVINEFYSIKEAARHLGCTDGPISHVLNGHSATAKGFKFKYKD